ncbi:MAG: cation transporter [Bacilli bacterium]|nr:cation transporter [Bacilli bacterium]
MKKNTYKLTGIDCAACALKIEDGVNKLDGVESSSMNFMLMKFFVNFDENKVSDEEIELGIHKSLNGVRIVSKNNEVYEDTYEEPKVFKKINFFGRKRK